MVPYLRGWIDYDREYLPSLKPAERIDYFEKRVRLVAINPLARILKTEILVEDSSALLIFGVSLCCAIEATGKFLTGGQGGNAMRFHAFLAKYMSADYAKTIGGLSYGEALWQHFRNGLAHGFTVCHGGFEGNPDEPYFAVKEIAGHDSLEINPTLLYDDYLAGFERYLAELRGRDPTDPLLRHFHVVFEQVFIQGN